MVKVRIPDVEAEIAPGSVVEGINWPVTRMVEVKGLSVISSVFMPNLAASSGSMIISSSPCLCSSSVGAASVL